ncbi:hypothetical protein C8029_04145 [Roseobacter sp. TSBP12]|nr:hypothetical protein C8029_04145 [Roseobacter sp. TSBP12]
MRLQFRSNDQEYNPIATLYMPEWLVLALSYDLIKVEPMSKDNDYLVIKGKDGKDQPVESNSWIICDSQGNLSSMSRDEFEDEFERAVDQ